MRCEHPFRLTLLIVTVVQTAISLYYLRQAQVGENLLKNRQAGPLLTASIVASYIAYAASVLLYLIQPRWMGWSSLAIPAWGRWIAVGPLLCGGTVVIWGLRGIGTNLTISPSTKEDHRLVTTGAYGWVRHPLYTGVFVESVGVCLLMANWFVSLCAATFCVLIAIRTRIEEDNLVARFGDEYNRYQENVGKFLPRFAMSERWLSALLSTPALLFVSFLTYLVIGGIAFGLAGRVDLPWVWMSLGTLAVSHLVMVWLVFRRDPGLARERLAPGPGVPVWDKLILWLSGVLILANLAAAALDVGRLHWSDSVSPALQFTGLIGIVLGMALMAWAMAVNTFFSKAVRIQEDRGHCVVQSGPYRFVRHPGYVGWLVLWISFNLALGSWLTVGISLLMICVVIARTALEDRFLRNHLAGYAEYAYRVKWRLVPGIW